MYIRRKVFSLLHDEAGEERYFSTTEINLEDAEERIFSVNEEKEDKKKPKLTVSDKIKIKLNKALTTKKDREAMIEAYEEGKSHKLGKQSAKYGAIGGAIVGGMAGSLAGKKGALIGAGLGAATSAAGSYAGTRLGVYGNKKLRKISGDLDTSTKQQVDIVKVADGRMTEEEFAKKWRSK